MRIVGAAVLVAAMSCGDTTAPNQANKDLDAARERWHVQNLHTYAFMLQRTCFCVNTHPLYVAVVSDSVVGVLDFETGEMVDRQFGATVEGLFSFIQSATDGNARLIRTAYDATKGFPTSIDYDGSAQIADDEVSYRISDVHPITPQQ